MASRRKKRRRGPRRSDDLSPNAESEASKRSPAEASSNSEGKLKTFLRQNVTKFRLLMLSIILTTVVLGFSRLFSSGRPDETLNINGVEFRFDPEWDDVEDFNWEHLQKVLQWQTVELRKYVDVPDGLQAEIAPLPVGSTKGEVPLELSYYLERFEKEAILDIRAVDVNRRIKINPSFATSSSMLHELFHRVRLAGGAFTLHYGVEEGLAEYVENEAYPEQVAGEATPDIILFFDTFPELEKIPFEDEVFGYREILGISYSQHSFTHESRRRAWARFLEDSDHPERSDFIRRLQAAQQEDPRTIWSVGEVLEIGDTLDPGFSAWFNSEPVFQNATEQRVIRAIRRGQRLTFLSLQQRKVEKTDPRHPDIFELTPFKTPLLVHGTLNSGTEFELDVSTSDLGIIQQLNLNVLRQPVRDVTVSLPHGEEVPVVLMR